MRHLRLTSSVAVIFETLPLQLLICDVIFEGLFRQDFVLPRPPIFGGYLTSLLLLEYAIEFAEADAAKDWNRLEPITAQNIVCEQYNETVRSGTMLLRAETSFIGYLQYQNMIILASSDAVQCSDQK